MRGLTIRGETAPRSIFSAALFLAFLVLPRSASAQTEDALAFAETIYKLPGLWLDASGSDTARQLYLTPDLAALIAENRAGNPALHLDYDPLVDDEEEALTDLSLTIEEATAAKALIRAEFLNVGEPATVTLELDRLGDGWRLANIWFADGRSVADELEWLNGGG